MNEQIKAAIIDLDGTVYRGATAVPGAVDAIQRLRDIGLEILFLSNNPTRRREAYVSKLGEMGISVDEEDVLTSAWVTAQHLSTEEPGKPTFVIGEEAILEELQSAGVTITDDPQKSEVLVASLDRSFDYEKLTRALQALDSQTLFIATNPDRTWPVEKGEIPDTWGMVGAIEGVTGRSVDRLMGKPSDLTIEAAMSRLDTDPEHCLMVGDRLDTDVKMGVEAGMRTVLVMSGVSDYADIATGEIKPDYVLDSLREVPELCYQ